MHDNILFIYLENILQYEYVRVLTSQHIMPTSHNTNYKTIFISKFFLMVGYHMMKVLKKTM